MKKYYYILFLLFIFIVSCKSATELQTDHKILEDKSRKIIRIHQSKKIASIFPASKLNNDEKTISQQIFEGLLKYNPQTLELDNCLIKNYTIDSTGTVYTFELKEDIFFHEAPFFKTEKDRRLTSNDALYCIDRLCVSDHPFSNIIKNKNIAKDKYVSGLKFIDPKKFSVSLNKPNQLFIHLLAQIEASIYPQKMIEFSYDKVLLKSIGTGPFKIESKNDGKVSIKRNDKYHFTNEGKSKLPYLNQIQFIYEPNIDSALSLFEKGKIDLIKHLDSDVLFQLQYLQHQGKIHIDIKHQPMASLDFIGFNKKNPLGNDKNLRRALSLAIDKMQLLDQALDGEADHPSKNGFSPELFKQIGYNTSSLPAHTTNIDSALSLIAGIAFPSSIKNLTLSYNKEDIRHSKIATTLSKQFKSLLNIDLLIKPLHPDSLENAINKDQFQLFLKTYDYNSFHPLDFMEYLSQQNLLDINIEQQIIAAKYNLNKENSFKQCLAVEQSILEQHNILPLWSNEYYEIMQPDIENLYINAIKYYDFRITSIREIEQIRPQN